MPSLDELIAWLHEFAPLDLAEEWDNVGLLLGDPAQPVRKVMTCLTVTPESSAEAIAEQADLIVSHHPVLFKPIQRLTPATAEGRLLLPLLRAGVAVHSPHTAFDNCVGGINDQLAARLKLTDVRPLVPQRGPAQMKLVVFVPESDLTAVSNALFTAGAGRIGDYEQCSFRVAGTGTFFGTAASQPTVGVAGRREEVAEWRLEVVVPGSRVNAVVAALREAHSYEEPAFDLIPLQAPPAARGAGRMGSLPAGLPLGKLAKLVADQLRTPAVQLVGPPELTVRKVALCCGAGGSLLSTASAAGADAFLTGEVRFHDALAAEAAGLGVIVAGHYATERLGVENLAERLALAFPSTLVWASRREREPLSWSQAVEGANNGPTK